MRLSKLACWTMGVFILAAAGGCQMEQTQARLGQMTYFIGVDVSGSFRSQPEFQDALRFLAYYIHGHVNNLGGLRKPKALFVGSIGGQYQDDPQIFHTLFDFEGKTVEQIQADLAAWFGGKNLLTDFNMFFSSIAKLAKERNLTLAPMTILVISDGIPEGTEVKTNKREIQRDYSKISLQPIEYLARNITVRLVYASPKAAKNWEDYVAHRRVKLWTVPNQVMATWSQQLAPDKGEDEQTKLFEWIQYNVDYRVRMRKF